MNLFSVVVCYKFLLNEQIFLDLIGVDVVVVDIEREDVVLSVVVLDTEADEVVLRLTETPCNKVTTHWYLYTYGHCHDFFIFVAQRKRRCDGCRHQGHP